MQLVISPGPRLCPHHLPTFRQAQASPRQLPTANKPSHQVSIPAPISVASSCLPWLLTTLLLTLLPACPSSSPDFDSVYTRVTPAKLKPGDPIPMPSSEAILSVSGAIGAANDNGKIRMDLATIESIGLVEYKVLDPFENRKTLFRGVLMRDLLNIWQVDATATTLNMVALNDYRVEVPIATLRQRPVLFALQSDGQYMRPDYRGPAMLVFPYGYYKFQQPLDDVYWIWQIKAIMVK